MHGPIRNIYHISGTQGRSLRRIARRLGLIGAIPVITGAAAWYGWSWWTLLRFMESTDDAYVGGEVTTIASKVAGFIDTIAVTDNQQGKAGDLLVKLDDRDYRAQLTRADATVAAQDANACQSRSSASSAERRDRARALESSSHSRGRPHHV